MPKMWGAFRTDFGHLKGAKRTGRAEKWGSQVGASTVTLTE